MHYLPLKASNENNLNKKEKSAEAKEEEKIKVKNIVSRLIVLTIKT